MSPQVIEKTCRCADVHVLLGPQHEAAGQNDQCRAGAHGGSKLAQHNGEGIQVQDAAAAQGILDGAAHRHGRGVPQGQRRIGLRVAHHLLRPRYRRHGVAHGSGVEGIAAVAAKDLLADRYARQHCHHQHIDVHGGGHEQGDDRLKLSLEKSLFVYTRWRSSATRRSHRLPVSRAMPHSSSGRAP